MDKPTTIDQYISGFPEDIQERLEQVRQAIRDAVPFAGEKISYGIPSFKFMSVSVWYAGYKNHIGLYPMYGMEKFAEEIEAYRGKGTKSTLQFGHNKPLPLDLIAKLVRHKFEKGVGLKTLD